MPAQVQTSFVGCKLPTKADQWGPQPRPDLYSRHSITYNPEEISHISSSSLKNIYYEHLADSTALYPKCIF